MDNSESIIDRLNQFIEDCGLTRAQFADSCGIPRPTVTQILSGKNKKVGNDIISAVHTTYPEIPMLWLLFGEGDTPQFHYYNKLDENSIFEANAMPVRNDENHEEAKHSCGAIKLPHINTIVSSKKITKIVVFYSDDSFKEYNPSE